MSARRLWEDDDAPPRRATARSRSPETVWPGPGSPSAFRPTSPYPTPRLGSPGGWRPGSPGWSRTPRQASPAHFRPGSRPTSPAWRPTPRPASPAYLRPAPRPPSPAYLRATPRPASPAYVRATPRPASPVYERTTPRPASPSRPQSPYIRPPPSPSSRRGHQAEKERVVAGEAFDPEFASVSHVEPSQRGLSVSHSAPALASRTKRVQTLTRRESALIGLTTPPPTWVVNDAGLPRSRNQRPVPLVKRQARIPQATLTRPRPAPKPKVRSMTPPTPLSLASPGQARVTFARTPSLPVLS